MSTTLYSILGEGNNTSLLFALNDTHNRKVTTTTHEAARQLAFGLSRAYSCMPNALWDVALAYEGRPANARRTLLSVFDQVIAGTQVSRESCWDHAVELVRALAETAASLPRPVIAAVRAELAETILVDLDGILVAGVLWAQCYRPGYLRLVCNQILGDWTSGERSFSPFFDGIDDTALLPESESLNPAIGVRTVDYYSDDAWMVINQLRDLSSCHATPGEDAAEDLFADSGDEGPHLELVGDHLRSWVALNKPELVDAYPGLAQTDRIV